jgi:antitoxin component of RelBE/YafQ-DinJ toxin-antitoxin module
VKEKYIMVRFEEEKKEKLKEIAKSFGITVSALVTMLIYKEIEAYEKTREKTD